MATAKSTARNLKEKNPFPLGADQATVKLTRSESDSDKSPCPITAGPRLNLISGIYIFEVSGTLNTLFQVFFRIRSIRV